MLPYAVTSDGNASVVYDSLPEICRSLVPVFITLEVCDPLVADDLRNLGVGMHSCKMVFTFEERLENSLVRESLCHVHEPAVSAEGGSVGKHLVKSAVLAGKHALELFV